MRQHEPPERRRQEEERGERRGPEPPAEAAVLGLQRAAGNRAVSALLARQPAPADSRVPPTAERGATMTLGLGDDIGVIPLDSASWGDSRGGELHELHVSFVNNPAVPKIQQAALNGTPIPSVFFSTTGSTSTMTEVLVTNISMNDSGDGSAPYVQIALDFKTVEHKPVR